MRLRSIALCVALGCGSKGSPPSVKAAPADAAPVTAASAPDAARAPAWLALGVEEMRLPTATQATALARVVVLTQKEELLVGLRPREQTAPTGLVARANEVPSLVSEMQRQACALDPDQCDTPSPLLLVDATAPAMKVLELANALGPRGAVLGVLADGVVAEHRVSLGVTGEPGVSVQLDAKTDLATLAERLRASFTKEDPWVTVYVREGASTQHLVSLLDEIAAAGGKTAVLRQEGSSVLAHASVSSGIVGSAPGGSWASVLSTSGDFSAGFDERDVMGGLTGAEWEGGFGVSGVGPGGGGEGISTLGGGDYGTIGHGSGSGAGFGMGSGGRTGRRMRNTPRVTLGSAEVVPEQLDRNTIRRYVRRKMANVIYCFDKNGTTTVESAKVEFTITPDGRVTGATAQGPNREIESCLEGVIASITFPKPEGGGEVKVKYPFTFRPAEE